MSHFTSMKTAIRDVKALQMACKEMGLELIQNGVARGYANSSIEADYVIRLKGPYDVALKKQNDGSYEIVTDWWAGHVAKEIGENAGRLLQQYGIAATMIEARRKGYTVRKQQFEDGTIKLIMGVRS